MPLLPCFKLSLKVSTISVATFSSARHLSSISKVTAIAFKVLSLNAFGCSEAPCFALAAEENQNPPPSPPSAKTDAKERTESCYSIA